MISRQIAQLHKDIESLGVAISDKQSTSEKESMEKLINLGRLKAMEDILEQIRITAVFQEVFAEAGVKRK